MRKIMEAIRQRFSTKSLQLVSAPYLPVGLISAALLFTFTDLVVFLLGQPAGYWLDRSRAESSFPFLEKLLSAGILPYVLVGLIYLLLLWLALTLLTRSWALLLWMPFSFMHLSHILSWVLERSRLLENSGGQPWWPAVVNAVSALILGIILARGLLRFTQTAASSSRLATWTKPVASIAWVVTLVVIVIVSAVWPRGGWALMHPEHTPGRRGNTAVAYDPIRQKVVLFGGITEWVGTSFHHENDTWEWDGEDWAEIETRTTPLARAGHMMAYDEKNGLVVMFGGQEQTGNYMLNDTWVWDGMDWTQMFPDDFPHGRRGGQMFFDHETNKIILLGGFYYTGSDKVFTPLNDVWEWDGTTWRYLTTLAENLMITNPNVAYDTQLGQTILYNYNETVTWRDGELNAIVVENQPANRFGSWLTADPKTGRMLLFGGVGEKSVQLNDTWVLDGHQWQELHPDLTPSPRDAYVMFFDPDRNSFILYGGVSGYALDDMWEFVLP